MKSSYLDNNFQERKVVSEITSIIDRKICRPIAVLYVNSKRVGR